MKKRFIPIKEGVGSIRVSKYSVNGTCNDVEGHAFENKGTMVTWRILFVKIHIIHIIFFIYCLPE